MGRRQDIFLTAVAPMIWGSSFAVTTEFLPRGEPVWLAMLRALPAGLVLLAIVRRLPRGMWWGRVFLLGGINFTVFWLLLFASAYQLPGGVAATVGATQPLMVIFLSALLIGRPVAARGLVAACAGLLGVALLLLSPNAEWNLPGVVTATGSALSMATGTVLSYRWRPEGVSALTFAAWQLTAGGLLLVPIALVWSPVPDVFDTGGLAALAYLSLIGAAFTYLLWFRGLERLLPSDMAPLTFLSPLVAVGLGWTFLGQDLGMQGLTGVAVTLVAVWFSQAPTRIENQVKTTKGVTT